MSRRKGELTKEFREKYVKNLKGKEHVEYNGLRALAGEQDDFGFIKAYINQYPCPENKFTAFARAELYDKQGKLIGMEEADANVLNCNKMVGVHFPRMAITRAKGRLLREYLGVDMVTKEELQLYEPERADPKMIGKIKRLAKENGLKKELIYEWMFNQIGAEEFNELTEASAKEFLEYVEKRIARRNKKREEKTQEVS